MHILNNIFTLCTFLLQVNLSTRSGIWLIERQAKRGYPLDFMVTRATIMLTQLFPQLASRFLEKRVNDAIDHKLYGLDPQKSLFQSTSFVCDEFAFKLMQGAVHVRKDVKQFTKNGVEFVDGSKFENLDVVILCTGYSSSYPFLSADVAPKDMTQLYLTMFPLNRKHPTIVYPGSFRFRGSFIVTIEMQVRYAVKIIKVNTLLLSHLLIQNQSKKHVCSILNVCIN